MIDLIVDITVYIVGQSALLKRFNHFDDLWHMIADPGVYVCPADAQSVGILKVFCNVLVSDLGGGNAFLDAAVDDLVVHIGKVLDKLDIVADIF